MPFVTEDQAQAAFQKYLASHVNYDNAIRAAGDEPWHAGDVEKRRELFMRRYQTPRACRT
jgi:hypothetical protein